MYSFIEEEREREREKECREQKNKDKREMIGCKLRNKTKEQKDYLTRNGNRMYKV